ncbi:MAG TPA: sigma-70 family RNA polymerase sigma factor [Polyangiaceae bacterium]|nr:sigma-70 family RNA polymerase sigma factor [Polyangiaceae bacterium]
MRQPSEPKLYLVRPPPREEDDAALAVAAARGEPWAASAVWDRHSNLVRGMLRRALGATDVDDHVQEVFFRFFQHGSEMREPALLRSYLVGIAFRVAGSELRRRKVRRFLGLTPSGEVPSPAIPPLDAEAREAVVRLYEILDRLAPLSRLVFTMRYIEGLELTEVAAAAGTSLATVKRKLGKASDVVFRSARRDEALMSYLSRHSGREP